MDQGTREQLLYEANKKSLLVAYLLWWFLGYFGGHRFYLGKIGTAITMLMILLVSIPLALVLVGYVGLGVVALWWLVDAFLLPGMVRNRNLDLIGAIEARGALRAG